MIFTETRLKGAVIIELEKLEDQRGFFARTFCKKEFEDHGINLEIVQCNLSFNQSKGTVRGMHYQTAPHEEAKLVRCVRGSIYDVIIDLRPTSSTYKQWFASNLSMDNYRMLYIPNGFAHGFQTLEDNTEVFYQMSEFYRPEFACGIRWDDDSFQIEWPIKEAVISSKDQSYDLFKIYG